MFNSTKKAKPFDFNWQRMGHNIVLKNSNNLFEKIHLFWKRSDYVEYLTIMFCFVLFLLFLCGLGIMKENIIL